MQFYFEKRTGTFNEKWSLTIIRSYLFNLQNCFHEKKTVSKLNVIFNYNIIGVIENSL